MDVKVLIAVLFFQLALAQVLEKPLECKNRRSKICQLQTVSTIGLEVPKFPNLAEKHTLIIRSGDVPFFNESFTSQFGSVTKVTLGRLNIKALHIPANWVSLNAENNQIRELIVDGDDDDDDDSKDIYLSDGPIDSNETPESDPNPVGPGTKEQAKTGNTTDPNLETGFETHTGLEEGAKNDNTTDSEILFAKETRTAFIGGAKNDNTTDSELGISKETKTAITGGAKNDNTTHSEFGIPKETKTAITGGAKNDNTTDSELEFPKETKTAFIGGAKNDNTTDSELEFPKETKTAFIGGAKNNKTTDSELGISKETKTAITGGAKNDNTPHSELGIPKKTQAGFQEPFRGKSNPNHRPDPTEDDIDEYNTEKPAVNSTDIAEDTFAPISSNPADSKVTSQFTDAAPSSSVYKLQTLNLANNELQSIRKLKYMVNLEVLRLDGNELEFIEMATFERMTKLSKLSLLNNKISHMSCPDRIILPALELFSLASNRLAKLQVINWNMPQLVDLDLSHNRLVQLDVENFDQFVSLEKLAVSNNSWTCYWLNEALKETRDFITLVDRNDDPGNCPTGLPVEGICCSLTAHDDNELNNENLNERIQRFQKEQEHMGIDFKGKVGTFGKEWKENWEKVNHNVTAMRTRIEAKNKEPKDDSKVTERDIEELEKLISESKGLLAGMERLRNRTSLIGQGFTQLFYTTIDLKNKFLAAMRSSAKLKNDLHQYELSFKAYET